MSTQLDEVKRFCEMSLEAVESEEQTTPVRRAFMEGVKATLEGVLKTIEEVEVKYS